MRSMATAEDSSGKLCVNVCKQTPRTLLMACWVPAWAISSGKAHWSPCRAAWEAWMNWVV